MNQIDWTGFFKYAFVAAGVDENTKVALQEEDYLVKVTEMLRFYSQGDDKKELNRSEINIHTSSFTCLFMRLASSSFNGHQRDHLCPDALRQCTTMVH